MRKAHPDVEVRSSVIEGFPARVRAEASKDAELLVVGKDDIRKFFWMRNMWHPANARSPQLNAGSVFLAMDSTGRCSVLAVSGAAY